MLATGSEDHDPLCPVLYSDVDAAKVMQSLGWKRTFKYSSVLSLVPDLQPLSPIAVIIQEDSQRSQKLMGKAGAGPLITE